MKKRLALLKQDLFVTLRSWRARHLLRAETVTDLVGTVTSLRTRIDELERDLDELRADSRRVAELRIQVEDLLAERL